MEDANFSEAESCLNCQSIGHDLLGCKGIPNVAQLLYFSAWRKNKKAVPRPVTGFCLFCSFSLPRISTFGGKPGGSPPPPFAAPCLILGSSGSTAALGFPSCLGHGFGFFKDADSHVAPPSYPGTAVGASDETVICRMVWDDESIAATLTAPERGSVRVRLDRLRHDTASILVGRTTAGEKCGASLFSKRPLSRRIAKTRAHRREETNHG